MIVNGMRDCRLVVLGLIGLGLSLGLASDVRGEGEKDGAAASRIRELDALWAKVSKAVNEGDFEAYKSTCHSKGVLVSGIRGYSQPLSKALARWKKEFDATKAGAMQASVTFRFSQRVGDETTAHETGIFRYTAKPMDGEPIDELIHFEALLIKEKGRWLITMEYQQAKATQAAWDALK